MAVFRLVRQFVWRSKTELFWTALTLVVLAIPSRLQAVPAWLFDLERALMPFPIMMSRFLGREVAVLPVRRSDIWHARWLAATVGVTLLTNAARLVASQTPVWPTNGLHAMTALTLVVADFVEACVVVACIALLWRPYQSFGRQPLLRLLRWLAGLAILSAPVWAHVMDADVLNQSDIWTLTTIAILASGLALSAFGFQNPHFVVGRGLADVRPGGRAAGERPTRIPSAGPRSATNGAVRLLGREAARAAVTTTGALVVMAAGLRLLLGQWPVGRTQDGSQWIIVGAFMLATTLPFQRRLRVLRGLPISTDVLAAVPTLALAAGWAAALVLYAGLYREVRGHWMPAVFAASWFEMLAVTSAAKSVSLPFKRQWAAAFIGLPVFVIGVLLPAAVSVVFGMVAAVGLIVLSVMADYLTVAHVNRVYMRSDSAWR